MNETVENIGCFGFICAVIAFMATWASVIVSFPFFGLFLGWIPAAVVAFIVYLLAEIALGLFLFIIGLILLIAGVSYFS